MGEQGGAARATYRAAAALGVRAWRGDLAGKGGVTSAAVARGRGWS